MFPFFTISVVIFIIVFTIGSRKNSADQEKVLDEFWQKELAANSVRRNDISSLAYIEIPLDRFPMNTGSEAEEKLRLLSQEKILNLTGVSNTELKQSYGIANLETLSRYDTNFAELVKALSTYGKELYEADRREDALAVLEYAVSIQADAADIYLTLAKLYKASGEVSRIRELQEQVAALPNMLNESLIQKLDSYLS